MIGSIALIGGAVESAHAETIISRQDDPKKLDELFASLKRSKSVAIASDIANNIREEWTTSGSANVDLLMQWALEAMNRGDNSAAMDFLDQVVMLKPDFAEGWNRRATLHFSMNNYSKAMVDIEKTLQLEPRHFGALSGMGIIFLSLDNKEQALLAYQKALEVYPLMRDIQKTVGEIEDQLAGSRI
ncbi:MAG: tetratricopeptide repeat protein [Rhizobiaceae bacterium]